jgi:hypothetical protein
MSKKGFEKAKKVKMVVLTTYGGNPPKCACCGETAISFLTIDHINGDGNKHREQIWKELKQLKKNRKRHGVDFYKWLINNHFPEGFQVLCANCNMAKGQKKQRLCPVHHPELYKFVNKNKKLKITE